MFLKGLKDKWKYILKDGEYGYTLIFKNKPESESGSWKTKPLSSFATVNDLIDDLPLKEDRVYIIEDLIKGIYDNELLANKGE